MTYPLELRESTHLIHDDYPVNLFRNRCQTCSEHEPILGLHWHEHFEIIQMVTGQAVFHIESKPYLVAPGDCLFVPSGGLHVGYQVGSEPVEYIAIVFNKKLLNIDTKDSAHHQYVRPYLEGLIQFPVAYPDKDPDNEVLSLLVNQTVRELELKDRAYELAVKHNLYSLFIQLSRRFSPFSSEPQGTNPNRRLERFKPLFLFVDEHPTGKISVEEAAGYVNLNPYHFCKMFKKITGRTFVEYMNLQRVSRAEQLLRETDYTITEIAELIGCGNPNYFTKLFKQYRGVAPSRIR
ncbi:hypothetical protein SY83_14225 [Paenibacillus swuensis]|uniref:HTH araC/xylS-type domain-containing protein n=1 Tax=Paenibacillus swuensis TaxID=1178515 RepID=A0A172TJK0_9BACL|nr:AraC family transcriptional regulator [Paenibacillus swuensis]ANE47231.1 hypothetical protein SY83_14225 [Paenibacillus swuensis]